MSPGRVPFEHKEVILTKDEVLSRLEVQLISNPQVELTGELFLLAVRTNTNDKKLAIVEGAACPTTILATLNQLVQQREVSGSGDQIITVKLPAGSTFEEAGVLELGDLGNSLDQYSILEGYSDPSKLPAGVACTKSVRKGLTPHRAVALGRALGAFLGVGGGKHFKNAVVQFPAESVCEDALRCFIEGMYFGVFPERRFKGAETTTKREKVSVSIVVAGGSGSVAEQASTFALGTQLARELTNSPPNMCNPETLALVAEGIAKEVGLASNIMGRDECEALGMGAYLAVNQGSLWEPRFIHLTYTPPSGNGAKKIAFIGKGICMDTGGYNLKTSGSGIETMKFDMGGASAVLGAAKIIGKVKPSNVEVHFIIAAAENMIGPKAYRPGDIVKSASGTTVEVGNTDAEGRLTLADALWFAEEKVKPDFLMDVATLTGACMVALGDEVGGLYSTCNAWMDKVLKSAQKTGTALWPMPLVSIYKRHNESKIADITNCASTRYGGSITAALFLREFVKKTPWCHLDVAGPVYNSTTRDATGYGARLLAHIALSM